MTTFSVRMYIQVLTNDVIINIVEVSPLLGLQIGDILPI